jgi:hypothetical protein
VTEREHTHARRARLGQDVYRKRKRPESMASVRVESRRKWNFHGRHVGQALAVSLWNDVPERKAISHG